MIKEIKYTLATDVQLTYKIGIIGYRNHAKKILDIVDANKKFDITHIFHPTREINDPHATNNLEKLYNCDAVIIASPNSTHLEYIQKLIDNSKCYIFCEKPPVTSMEGIKYLENLSLDEKKRIYFNFNLRFSELKKILDKYLSLDIIGKPIQINIVASMGLAFKEKYKQNWRSDGEQNMHNIIENVSIHWIDLVNYYFGENTESSYFPRLISKNGTSYDTSLVNIKFKNGLVASIFNSYATPLINNIIIIGTNGNIVFDDGFMQVFSPRDSFDEKGLFIKPKCMIKTEFNFNSMEQDSLQNSLDYFLSHIENSEMFDVSDFNKSIISNNMVLNLEELYDHHSNQNLNESIDL
tara:strand:+ start:440 stop:1495 length:1056 start_codon:yes stop_codon:yes gene_type:complete